MKWHSALGFAEDPFLIGAIAGTEEMLDDITYFVRSGSMIFIEEPNGWMIHKILERFSGRKKAIFVDAEDQKVIPIEELLIGSNGIIGRALNKLPKDMMLFVENTPILTKRNAEKLKHYYDNGNIHSIIFSGTSYEKANLPESMRDRIGSRVFSLPRFTEQLAINSVQHMLDSTVFFPAQLIRMVHKRYSEPTEFFEMCSRICEHTVRAKAEKVNAIHLQVMHAE